MALLTAGSRERLHRDAQCAADVGKMQEFGRFPSEFKIYGCANLDQNGEIYYRATTEEEKLYQYMKKMKLRGNYFTPVVSLSKYIKVSADEKEEVVNSLKLKLIQSMKKTYEPVYFSAMKPLFSEKANDSSVPLLKEYCEEIYGYYDDLKLQLFEGFLETAYEGKVLTQESYDQFYAWYDSVRSQMTDEPVSDGRQKRTFYGFVYFLENGTKKTFVDARFTNTLQKRESLLEEGKKVGRIVYKTYWFDELVSMREVKEQYIAWLLDAENENYFERMHILRNLPGVISQTDVDAVKERFQDGSEGYLAVCHYDKIWNKKIGK